MEDCLQVTQLQAKNKLQHQTKQAQFSIKIILMHSYNFLAALTVFSEQLCGYSSISGHLRRGGHLAFPVAEFRVFTRKTVGISPPLPRGGQVVEDR